jgi:hypothetical protein
LAGAAVIPAKLPVKNTAASNEIDTIPTRKKMLSVLEHIQRSPEIHQKAFETATKGGARVSPYTCPAPDTFHEYLQSLLCLTEPNRPFSRLRERLFLPAH